MKKPRNIKLVYDVFSELNKMWDFLSKYIKNSLYFQTIPKHSKDNICLRIVDWFLGFLCKLLLDLNKDRIESRDNLNTQININNNTLNFINKNKDFIYCFKKVY